MSFDSLVSKAVDEIRERVKREILEACALSADNIAVGYLYFSKKKKRGVNPQHWFKWDGERATRCRYRNSIRRKIVLGRTIDELDDDMLMSMRRLKWLPKRPLHPLQALARVPEERYPSELS